MLVHICSELGSFGNWELLKSDILVYHTNVFRDIFELVLNAY